MKRRRSGDASSPFTSWIADLLNRVLVMHGGDALMYERPPLPGDAQALLLVVAESVEARKKLRKKLAEEISALAEPDIKGL